MPFRICSGNNKILISHLTVMQLKPILVWKERLHPVLP